MSQDEQNPEVCDQAEHIRAEESIMEAHRLSLDPSFKYMAHEKIQKTGQIQAKAKQIGRHAKIVDEANIELASMARQQDVDIDGMHVKISQQKTATTKVSELALDMKKQACSLVKMEEAHSKYIDRVYVALAEGITAEKKTDAKQKKRSEMEAIFHTQYPTVLIPLRYDNRPKIGADRVERLAFLKDLDQKYKTYAYSKKVTPYFWFCCWGVDTSDHSKEKCTMEIIKHYGIPARYPILDVFAKESADDDVRIKMLDDAIAFQKNVLITYSRDPERADFYPTLYMAARKKGERNDTIKRKMTRAGAEEMYQNENYHFCEVGTVKHHTILTYIPLDEFKSKKYNEISYADALKIVLPTVVYSENTRSIFEDDVKETLTTITPDTACTAKNDVLEGSNPCIIQGIAAPTPTTPKRKRGSDGNSASNQDSDCNSKSNSSASKKSHPTTFEPTESCLKNHPQLPKSNKEKAREELLTILKGYKSISFTKDDKSVQVVDLTDLLDICLQDN